MSADGLLTYILFGEDAGEAQVARDLGLEQAVFPQVSVHPVRRLGNLKGEGEAMLNEMDRLH